MMDEYPQYAQIGGDPGTAPPLKPFRVVRTGPNNEADFTDSRYWVRELTISFNEDKSATFALKTNGLWVVATNTMEYGLSQHGMLLPEGVTLDRSFQGSLPDRIVWVRKVRADGYVFDAIPGVMIPDSLYLDVRTLTSSGCLSTSKWLRGTIFMSVFDGDALP